MRRKFSVRKVPQATNSARYALYASFCPVRLSIDRMVGSSRNGVPSPSAAYSLPSPKPKTANPNIIAVKPSRKYRLRINAAAADRMRAIMALPRLFPRNARMVSPPKPKIINGNNNAYTCQPISNAKHVFANNCPNRPSCIKMVIP